MLSSFYRFIGKRQSLPNDFQGCVEILAWYHPACVPAQHLALRIRDAGETHYLSFSPKSLHGLSDRGFFQLRHGVEAIFVEYADELLIQGFRNAWPGINNDLTDEQKAFIATNKVTKLSDMQILALTENFSPDQKALLRESGKPTEVIELRSLNLEAMIKKIHYYKTAANSIKWASWSGTYFHEANTHNCASIVLDVLYAGGFGKLIHSNRDLLTLAGAVLGASYALLWNQSYLETITEIVVETLKTTVLVSTLGRSVGGALEGYTGIQSFLNLVAIQGKDDIGTILGLRIASFNLGALMGFIKLGPVVPAVLTMPREVLILVQQAKIEEESMFSFSTRASPSFSPQNT